MHGDVCAELRSGRAFPIAEDGVHRSRHGNLERNLQLRILDGIQSSHQILGFSVAHALHVQGVSHDEADVGVVIGQASCMEGVQVGA